MHITVYQDEPFWVYEVVTARGEVLAIDDYITTKKAAIFLAKRLVRAIVRPLAGPGSDPIVFTVTERRNGETRIEWS